MIELVNVTKTFEGKEIIKDLTARFKEGEVTCISGPSGSGKTTLLRLIAGLIEPDTGTVSGVSEKLSFVFQEDRLFEAFSGISNIRALTGKKVSEAEIRAHFSELGLSESAELPVGDYSGGMKRRVSLIRAVLRQPEVLLLDEPFKGLDPEMRKSAVEYVKRHTVGKTVLCVTHDPEEIRMLGGEEFVLSSL